MPHVASRDQRRDPKASQHVAVRLRIVSAVGDKHIRLSTRTTGFSPDRRNSFNERKKLGDIVRVGSSENRSEWDPVTVGDHVMFAPSFPSVRGIRADFRPPKTALTELESATARVQSILSASWSLASITS